MIIRQRAARNERVNRSAKRMPSGLEAEMYSSLPGLHATYYVVVVVVVDVN